MTTITFDSQLRRLQLRQRMILLLSVMLIGGGLAMLINLASAPYPTESDPILNLPALLSTPAQAAVEMVPATATQPPPLPPPAGVGDLRTYNKGQPLPLPPPAGVGGGGGGGVGGCIASQTGGFDCPGGLHIKGWRMSNGEWEVIN